MANSPADLDRWVLLATLPGAAEAAMVAELLSNNGIETVLQGANFSSLEPLRLPGSFSEVRLLVLLSQCEAAEEFYRAFFVDRTDEVQTPAAAVNGSGDHDGR